MEDPLRIPRVLEELRLTWEGQPELPLATLFGTLANRGVGWGTTDEELVEVLRHVRLSYPPDLPRDVDGRVQGTYLVTTEHPGMAVTINSERVAVRAAGDPDRQPGAWNYSSVRATGPGRPLVVADTEEIEHRFGVVTGVKVLDPSGAPALGGLERLDIGNWQWLIELEDGVKATVGHRIRLWQATRREVDREGIAWAQIVRAEQGRSLLVTTTAGGVARDLGVVERITLLDD